MKELNLEQMENIQGGVSAEKYCATIKMIINNNQLSEGALAGAALAMAKYC